MIPFSKPTVGDKEIEYIKEVFANNKLSGDGSFTKRCEDILESRYKCQRALLTSSCTAALEMSALLCDIGPGDEVIVPSYTFVTSASAFALRGAKIVFCDSLPNHPNMDCSKLESLITDKTKVIVPVHYGGVPCDMDAIMNIANKHNIIVVEDAAQAIESNYKGCQLGTIGHFGTFSFHDTKNITSGEGGALLINREEFVNRAEIIREKGTNRKSFFRGEVDKYGWVELGSSYLMSDVNAAILCAQLERIEGLIERRKVVWNRYHEQVSKNVSPVLDKSYLNEIGNGHLYVIKFTSGDKRDFFVRAMKDYDIAVTFHFLPLEESEFIKNQNYKTSSCENSKKISECIARLPLYNSLQDSEVDYIITKVNEVLESIE